MPLRGSVQAFRPGVAHQYHKPSFTDYLVQGLGRSLGSLPSAAVGMLGGYLNKQWQDQNNAADLGRRALLKAQDEYNRLAGATNQDQSFRQSLNPVTQSPTAQIPVSQPPASLPNPSIPLPVNKPAALITPNSMSDTPDVLTGTIPPSNLFHTPVTQPVPGTQPTPASFSKILAGVKPAGPVSSISARFSTTDNNKAAATDPMLGKIPAPLQASGDVAKFGLDTAKEYKNVSSERLATRMEQIKQAVGDSKHAEPIALFDVALEDNLRRRDASGQDVSDPMVRASAAYDVLGALQRKYGRVHGKVLAIKALDKQAQAYGDLSSRFLKTAQQAAGDEARAYTALGLQALRNRNAAMSIKYRMQGKGRGGPMSVRKWLKTYVNTGTVDLDPNDYQQLLAVALKDHGNRLSKNGREYVSKLDVNTARDVLGYRDKLLKRDKTKGEIVDQQEKTRLRDMYYQLKKAKLISDTEFRNAKFLFDKQHVTREEALKLQQFAEKVRANKARERSQLLNTAGQIIRTGRDGVPTPKEIEKSAGYYDAISQNFAPPPKQTNVWDVIGKIIGGGKTK